MQQYLNIEDYIDLVNIVKNLIDQDDIKTYGESTVYTKDDVVISEVLKSFRYR